MHERDIRADGDDLAAHFVSDRPGRMDTTVSPGIPIVNMGIGSAQGGGFDLDDGVRWTRCGIGPLDVGQARLCRGFDKRAHGPIITRAHEMPSRTENLSKHLFGIGVFSEETTLCPF